MMNSMFRVLTYWRLVFAIFGLLLPIVVAADCYNPDSTLITSKEYRPCNTTAEHSMCCATNRDQGADTCLPNGLCFNPLNCSGDQGCVKDPVGVTWRESCTDPTWTAPECVQACFSGANRSVTDTNLTSCGPTKGFDIYCCGSNNAACCKSNQGFAIINFAIVQVKDLPSTTSSTASTASTSLPPSSTTTTAGTTDSGSLSTSTKIAIAVPVSIVGALIIAGIIFWLLRRNKRKNSPTESIPMLYGHSEKPNAAALGELGASDNKANPQALRAELAGEQGGAELPGQSVPVEMSSDNYSPRPR